MTIPITGQGLNVYIPPDDELSLTSTKAAQNKVITEEITNQQNAISELGGKTRNLNTAGVGRYRATDTGVIQPDPGSTTIFGMDDLVECDGNTAYTATIYDLNAGNVWIYLCWYDVNKNYLTVDSGNGLSITKTSPSSAKYMYVHTYKGGTGIPDISDGKIQIEKGTESTDYVPPFSAIDVVARNEIGKLNTTVSGLPTQSDFTEIQTQLNKTVAEQNTGIEYLYGTFQNGTLADGVFQDYAKFRVATDTIMTYDRGITLTIASGYKIGVHIFINGVFNRDSGWITNGHYTIPEGTEFKCVIAKNPEDTSIIADVDTFVSAVTFPTYTQDQIDSISAGSESATALSTLLEYDKAFGKRYVCHFGTPYYDGMIIPSQSKFDIERARKAGFTAIEFNLQITSDGKYIVGHGVGGNFGNEFYHVDGDDISNVAINSVTLAYIKEKIRCKSAIEKYKVAPLTLEEALICCKNNGIMPAISYTTAAASAFAIAEKIIGKDNFIALVYTNDRPSGFHGACASWYALTDKNEILAKCQASGGAYSMGLDVTNAAYSDFTLDDWKEITDLLHENGYRVNAAYVLDHNLQHVLEKAGFDYIFATYQVPEIDNGSICNLSDNNTFSDFNHNGTVVDGKLQLTAGQYVEPSEAYPALLSSGGSLHISFTGSINISMTSYINNTITSNDPTDDWWFSTYYNGIAPTFKITAVENATINELSFKASRY